MRYSIIYGPSAAVLPNPGLDKMLASMTEHEIKLFVYLCCKNGACDTDTASDELGIAPSHIDKAAQSLSAMGLLGIDGTAVAAAVDADKKKTPTAKELPHYSGEEMAALIEKNGLGDLIDECQRILGTIFSTTEISRIVAMVDYLKLDGEYLLILFTHCNKIGKKSIAYISKTAFSLFDEGIDTPQKLEYRLKATERVYDMESKLRRLFGFGDRAWTPREKEYLQKWIGEWDYSYEVLEKAYNITVDKTRKMSPAYMNKVLQNWHDSGYKTIEEVEQAQEAYKRSKESSENESKGSFDVNEFFDLALKNSYSKMKARRKNEGE